MSPTVQEILLEHGSAHLPKAFEVQGFTVQGKVKGHSGAKVFVNGVMKATSGHDGSFSIANMKAGTYEFEVTAGSQSIYPKINICIVRFLNFFFYYFRQVPV